MRKRPEDTRPRMRDMCDGSICAPDGGHFNCRQFVAFAVAAVGQKHRLEKRDGGARHPAGFSHSASDSFGARRESKAKISQRVTCLTEGAASATRRASSADEWCNYRRPARGERAPMSERATDRPRARVAKVQSDRKEIINHRWLLAACWTRRTGPSFERRRHNSSSELETGRPRKQR